MALAIPVLALSTTAVIWPSVRSCKIKAITSRDVEVDPTETSETTISSKATTTGIEITVTAKESTKTVDSIKEIRIGDKVLSADEYSFDPKTGVITIKIDVLEKHSGKIVVKPSVVEKKQVSITITSKHNEVIVEQSVVTSAKLAYTNADTISWTQSSEDGGQVSFNKETTASEQEIQITGATKGTVKITATCGSASDSFTISVKDATKQSFEIVGDHQFEYSDEAGASLGKITAKDQSGTVIKPTFTCEPNDVINVDSEGVITSIGASNGGSVTITGKAEGYEDATFEVEVASFSKVQFINVGGVEKVYATGEYAKRSEITGALIIPSRHWQNETEINITALYCDNDSNGAFDSTGINKVVIPDSITDLEPNAFYECEELSDIKFSSNLTSISPGAFEGCSALKTVEIPNNVNAIGDQAFSSCTTLENITLSNSITSIGENAFTSCRGLKNITLPNSLETIGKGAFEYSGLIKITIPSGVSNIGDYAFEGCEYLTEVTIDSETVYTQIDGESEDKNFGYLIENAETIYVPEGKTPSTYITNNFEKGESTKAGYDVWNKKQGAEVLWEGETTINWGASYVLISTTDLNLKAGDKLIIDGSLPTADYHLARVARNYDWTSCVEGWNDKDISEAQFPLIVELNEEYLQSLSTDESILLTGFGYTVTKVSLIRA